MGVRVREILLGNILKGNSVSTSILDPEVEALL